MIVWVWNLWIYVRLDLIYASLWYGVVDEMVSQASLTVQAFNLARYDCYYYRLIAVFVVRVGWWYS